MKEIWKDVPGFEGYKVSNLGRVKSFRQKKKDGKLLKFYKCRLGYSLVWIRFNKKRIGKSVHRLVAEAFIPNPENKPEVNHKNLDKSDNRYINLEWCTRIENMKHAARAGVFDKPKGYDSPYSKAVERYDLNGNYIDEFGSISEAFRNTGISIGLISSACSGRRNMASGYIWKHK